MFPQVTLLIEQDVFVVLHDLVVPPWSPVTETKKWSASLMASQEIVMSFDEQLTSALTF